MDHQNESIRRGEHSTARHLIPFLPLRASCCDWTVRLLSLSHSSGCQKNWCLGPKGWRRTLLKCSFTADFTPFLVGIVIVPMSPSLMATVVPFSVLLQRLISAKISPFVFPVPFLHSPHWTYPENCVWRWPYLPHQRMSPSFSMVKEVRLDLPVHHHPRHIHQDCWELH